MSESRFLSEATVLAGVVGGLFVLGTLSAAPAAGSAVDDCHTYTNSSWSDRYLTCAGTGGGCTICVGSVIVYKGQDDGSPPPLGTEFAAVSLGSPGSEQWANRAESFPTVNGLLRLGRACPENDGLFAALDPRDALAPRHEATPAPVKRHRSLGAGLTPVP